MDHLRAVSGSYLGVQFSGQARTGVRYFAELHVIVG
jgi:hypothetical protein